MSEKNYNLWYTVDNRWVRSAYKGIQQDPSSPLKLSLEDVKYWQTRFGKPEVFVIRELLADGITGGEFYRADVGGVPIHSSTAPAINNHVCPTCKNDRCNKSEPTCWKCGSPLC